MMPDGAEPKDGEVDAAEAQRQPYRAPKLRHLGSVRELTLGNSGVGTEGFFMKMGAGKGN